MADKGFTPDNDNKALRNELEKLRRENNRLKMRLEHKERLIDLQKKLCRSWSRWTGTN